MSETFEKIKHWISAHPLATAAIVFTIGLILIWWYFSGNRAAPSQADNSSLYNAAAQANNANDQLAATQLAAQAQTNQVNAEAAVATADIAARGQSQTDYLNAQVTIEKLITDASIVTSNNTLAAQEAEFQTQLAEATLAAGTTRDTLSAQVAEADIAAKAATAAAGYTYATNIHGQDVQQNIAGINSQAALAEAGVAANEAISVATIAATRDVQLATVQASEAEQIATTNDTFATQRSNAANATAENLTTQNNAYNYAVAQLTTPPPPTYASYDPSLEAYANLPGTATVAQVGQLYTDYALLTPSEQATFAADVSSNPGEFRVANNPINLGSVIAKEGLIHNLQGT